MRRIIITLFDDITDQEALEYASRITKYKLLQTNAYPRMTRFKNKRLGCHVQAY